MLFSNDRIAKTINEFFEPVWIAVRPVPLVRIDFGNGTTLTRTLHGNVATSLCDAEGHVLDIIPGVYEPKTYGNRLDQFALLWRWLREPNARPQARLKEYHAAQATSLAKGQPPRLIGFVPKASKPSLRKTTQSNSVQPLRQAQRLQAAAPPKAKAPVKVPVKFRADTPKMVRIEGPLKLALMPARKQEPNPRATAHRGSTPPSTTSGVNRALLDALAEDSRFNESTRRLQVHRYLAKHTTARPDTMTKWLYREVLHVDLDDQYLGLGDLLFATYPFRAEDERWLSSIQKKGKARE